MIIFDHIIPLAVNQTSLAKKGQPAKGILANLGLNGEKTSQIFFFLFFFFLLKISKLIGLFNKDI